MRNLTNSQKWVIVSFIAAAAIMATTLFLQGDVRTFAFIIIGLFVAGYAVLSGDKTKKKNATSK